ncbi:ABC transporter substrate-binding protein [Salinicoccus sp. CNSTN-B1]
MKKYLYIISLAVAFTLSACGTDSEVESENASKAETNSISIEHAMGTTEIEGEPERIVSLYQGATDGLVAMDIEPVGAVESWVQQPMYDYLSKDLENTTYVGLETQPNLEEIAKLDPDLIIASKVRHEEIYDKLSKIAPTVTHETVDKFKDTLNLIGEATGKEDKAEALLNDWENRVSDFQKQMDTKYEDWPYKASVINFRADHARIYIGGFPGDILSELGFERSDAQTKELEAGNDILKLQSTESIPTMNGDIFFMFKTDVHNPDSNAVMETYDKWSSHPLWANLDAVEQDKVYEVDEISWNLGGGYQSANMMLDELYEHFELEK